MSTTAAATTRSRSRAACRRPALDVQVDLAVAQFRQGGGAARRARPCAARRRAVHGRRRPASAGSDRARWSLTGSMTATTWSTPPRPIARTSRRCAGSACSGFYTLINWGARQQDPRGCRRLPPALAARGGGAAPDARAQPLLQGAGELDRLPPDARRLRTGRARARRDELELRAPARPLDRGADVVLGRAAARREPARHAARRERAGVRRLDDVRGRLLWRTRAGLSVADRRHDGDRRRAAHDDRRHGRIHRQDPLRDQGAAGLFRRRAQREGGARRTPRAARAAE